MITKRRILIIFTTYTIIFFLSLLIVMMFSYDINSGFESIPYMALSGVVIFTLALYCAGKFSDFWSSHLHNKDLDSGLTTILNTFVNEVRSSYSIDEIISAIKTILEDKGDCSVLLVDGAKEYVIYNSPSNITQNEKTFHSFVRNFSHLEKDGYYFFDENLGLLSEPDDARGFFILFCDIQLIIFCNSTRMFAPVIFELLFEELLKFFKRYKTILSLSSIDELSQEWAMVAETQKSFLPQTLPTIHKLDMAVLFKPLINVSGDYYTIIELSKTKTLVLLGDVSGKGFSAALIMGIVINMVKTIGATTNLPDLVRAIHKTIKDMHFQDKYTVLFVGIIDTEIMKLSYINASMADPCLLTQSPLGYKIKKLKANCGIVGLIEIENIEVTSVPLFWNDVLFLATDGISETTDKNGIELGSTRLYANTIKQSAAMDPQTLISNIDELARTYNGGKKFKDDITMLAIKVEK